MRVRLGKWTYNCMPVYISIYDNQFNLIGFYDKITKQLTVYDNKKVNEQAFIKLTELL